MQPTCSVPPCSQRYCSRNPRTSAHLTIVHVAKSPNPEVFGSVLCPALVLCQENSSVICPRTSGALLGRARCVSRQLALPNSHQPPVGFGRQLTWLTHCCCALFLGAFARHFPTRIKGATEVNRIQLRTWRCRLQSAGHGSRGRPYLKTS